MRESSGFTFLEFFAGGGMVRAGLGDGWNCLFANDIDRMKSLAYRCNWGSGEFELGDVAALTTDDLPEPPSDLLWASFPCQDLSLAGVGAGLNGERSGTFRPFWSLTQSLIRAGRAPKIIALENVCGALTSHQGMDFTEICRSFRQENYQFGAVVIDACHFVPQSRPRLFIIGIHETVPIPEDLSGKTCDERWSSNTLIKAKQSLPDDIADNWVWWQIPTPEPRRCTFADLIEVDPAGVSWHSKAETERIIGMMSPRNLEKVDAARKRDIITVGGIYKRTRTDDSGAKVQRAEIRFDDLAGCLRTPTGGSSRQTIMVVDRDSIRTRLLSARETARLMGLPDTYSLPAKYNDAYHLTGDGVVVPVVRHLAKNIFEPIIRISAKKQRNRAA